MFPAAILEAYYRTGLVKKLVADAVKQAKRDNRIEDADLYYHFGNQATDAYANR